MANLAERLANTDGKHAFSFTPEADTVAQKWKTSISDFSVMLRQSYDGSRYEREARSAEAVNVHIEHLLWNVCMCGTPDCIYRVVRNYTDGLQSRIAFARTPDNTFTALEDHPPVLTARQQERIQQVAHLLPLMQGEVVLPKLDIIIRSNADIETDSNGRERIVVTELPYGVVKDELVKNIADLSADKKIEGISVDREPCYDLCMFQLQFGVKYTFDYLNVTHKS